MNIERRCWPRQIVSPLVYVNLDQDNRGILHNVSEGGLAITSLVPLASDRVTHLGFRLDSNTCVEARGQIAWTNEIGTQAGIRFLYLPETSYQQMKKWLSLNLRPRGVKAEIAIQREAVESRQLRPATSERELTTEAAHLGAANPRAIVFGSHSPIGRLLALCVLLGACFALGYVLGRQGSKTAKKEPASHAEDLAASATRGLANAHENPLLTPPFIPPGAILLQLGAFTHERNALALAEALREKKFPAFVLRPNSNHYYRVQVGPYTDAESAQRSKRVLEREGFKAMIKR